MNSILLPHGALVLVGDGRKALVLRNEGDARFPNLKTTTALDQGRVPPTAALGTDKPGRAIQSADGRRAGMDQTDWHELAEHRFAAEVAQALDARHTAGEIDALVVVAPPRTLADLRRSFSDALRAKIIAEVDKDLTNHPVYEIERLLFGGTKS
jgi:protein required for attachment to host cells